MDAIEYCFPFSLGKINRENRCENYGCKFDVTGVDLNGKRVRKIRLQ